MSEKSKAKYALKKQLRKLSEVKGSGTELISVYVPPKYPVAEVSNKLKNEYGQAANIKSKSTRTNVLAALEKIIHYLKMFREPPENGIAVFCGNVSSEPGKPDVQLFSVVPHEPVGVQLYRCDSAFFLEPLEYMLEAKDSYGLVVMDGRDATLALLKGKTTKMIKRIHSLAHGKHHKGGQSARRFERLIEEETEKYYKKIGEGIDEAFLNVKGLKGVIVGGPGPAKEDFLKMKPFNYQIKVLGMVDTGYTDEYGVRELQQNAEEIISEQEAVKEKAVIESFIKEVVKGGLATYGFKEVEEAIRLGKASKLLVSEGLSLKKIIFECSNCKAKEEKIIREAAEISCSCGGKKRIIEQKDVVDELLELAEKTGVEVEVVSTETNEGMQFLKGFYGIGAFLRYR